MTAQPSQHVPDVTIAHDGLILMLWNKGKGKDTLTIARQLGLHEWQVYNRLLHLREASR